MNVTKKTEKCAKLAETDQKFEQIFIALENSAVKPQQGIFFDTHRT